jgi:membrane-bound metal-dependent hydrolase YbcI (DUF457 family)
MLIFAHIFAGALLGLGFWHLTNDRRAVILCIIGSIIPDLIDKPLGLLLPSVLGGGRTLFHALLIILMLLLCIFMFIQSKERLLAAGVAFALLLHQLLDEMWLEPENWFFPLLGPFTGYMIPDYIRSYFWYEITNPYEWLCMLGTVVILVKTYRYTRDPSLREME